MNEIVQCMQPDLRKSSIIAQHRFFRVKHWNTLGKWLRIWKTIRNFFTHLVLGEGRGQRSNTGYHLICPSKRSSKIFVCLQCIKGIVSYGRLFTWRRNGCLWLMFLHGFQLCLWWCREVEGINFPVIHSSVHGEHNGTNFESVQHSIHKLQPF